ncbi:HAD-IIIA family hydrolase [Salinibacterium sp. ZJ454]|uniref:D-glycero-alpha-D-manno-heptose-1,7-bisphosphate 7-phosphatase n=1 Tax=Salinibacterium sp. ZJ454 TaxID=2708339 RepID=UPI001FB8B9B8|nr:HAD-IIIA family hydrolase [Salinibacterium sp. ZJ454]
MTRFAAPRAVLFDRDGTLVVDVPYNGDPTRVRLMPTVARSMRALRRRGIPTGVVSNQSGIGRGMLSTAEVDAVNRAIDAQAGPFDVWCVCPHTAVEGCGCRKPQPGLIFAAAEALGVAPQQVAVIGDIEADVEAAAAAGARGILVPTPATRPVEVERAPESVATVAAALELLFGEVVT